MVGQMACADSMGCSGHHHLSSQSWNYYPVAFRGVWAGRHDRSEADELCDYREGDHVKEFLGVLLALLLISTSITAKPQKRPQFTAEQIDQLVKQGVLPEPSIEVQRDDCEKNIVFHFADCQRLAKHPRRNR